MPTLVDLMDGTVGYFWPNLTNVGSLESALPGHVHRSGEGEMVLDLLAPNDVYMPTEDKLPRAFAATTSAGGALLLDVSGARYSSTLGGFRVATRRYRSRAVIFDVPVTNLKSDDLLGVTAFFPGIGRWAGLSGSELSREIGESGLLTSLSIEVRAADEQIEQLPSGRALKLTTHWQVDGPDDRRTIYAPVAVSVTSRRPSSWDDLVRPLLAVQGLLSMAYDGLVLSDGGQAVLDLLEPRPPLSAPRWWTSRLMQRPPGARTPSSMDEVPSFGLQNLGGIAGLRRWIALSRAHPRAAGPLVSRHRFGTVNAETRLMEIAAAIEYWVSVHRRQAKWTTKTDGGGAHAAALAYRVGAPFAELVGDASAWAKRFWSTYLLLKHDPNRQYDGYEVSILADGGFLLLECALLNRVGLSGSPARAICDSHRHYETGRATKALLGI